MDARTALARKVIRESLRIQPREDVIVESWGTGLDVAREIVYQLRAVGARPMFLLEDEETYWRSVETLPRERLGRVSQSEWAALAEADAYVFLPGPADIDRIRRNRERFQASIAYDAEWYRRAEKTGLRGARLLHTYVTKGRAARYGVDYGSWRSAMFRASLADCKAISREGRKVLAALSRETEVEITSRNDARLMLRLEGRTPRLEDGIVDAEDLNHGDLMTNLPPGYVYVAPDEMSAVGSVQGNLPIPYLGGLVEGVRLSFEEGLATWSALKGGATIRSEFSRAVGSKDRLAAICIGLNPEMRYGFLQDTIVRGAVEVSIGDNSAWGGRNRSSFFLGVRLSNATVRVGNRVLVKEGCLCV